MQVSEHSYHESSRCVAAAIGALYPRAKSSPCNFARQACSVGILQVRLKRIAGTLMVRHWHTKVCCWPTSGVVVSLLACHRSAPRHAADATQTSRRFTRHELRVYYQHSQRARPYNGAHFRVEMFTDKLRTWHRRKLTHSAEGLHPCDIHIQDVEAEQRVWKNGGVPYVDLWSASQVAWSQRLDICYV